MYAQVAEVVSLATLKKWLDKTSGDAVSVRVKVAGGLTLALHLQRSETAERLIVTFHGMRRVPADTTISMFFRHNWTQVYRGPVLALSDPLTDGPSTDPGPRSGFYVGKPTEPVAADINKIIDIVCAHLAVAPDQVVLYGASAGAGGAILVGSQRPSGCGVLAVCPLLRRHKVRGQVVEGAAKAAGVSKADVERVLKDTPELISPMHAMKASVDAGGPTRFFIAQCKEDTGWMNRNFRHIWKFFDLPPGGDRDATGQVAIVTYSSTTGHGPESDDLVVPLFDAAVEHFSATSNSDSALASSTEQ